MRNVLDCGVLLAPGHEDAMKDWVAGHRGGLARIRLHLVPLTQMPLTQMPLTQAPPADWAAPPPDVQTLARRALALRRYDCCILPVAPTSVAWARMALAQAGALLTTPVLLLMTDMKAPAIEDLLELGASDFIAQPACLESLRVRLARLTRHAQPEGAPGNHAPATLREPESRGYSRPRVSADLLEHALAGLRDTPVVPRHAAMQESFRLAKARVVDGFERDYIRHALTRHGGNVAQAARACSKHRRAFWALMRKHGIEAAPYRRAAQRRNAHSLGVC